MQKVVIVQNDNLLLGALEIFFRNLGMEPISFSSVEKASQAMMAGGLVPDLVVADLAVWAGHSMNSADLICYLRTVVGICRKPMILLADGLNLLSKAYPDLQALVVQKPAMPWDLRESVKRLLNGSN